MNILCVGTHKGITVSFNNSHNFLQTKALSAASICTCNDLCIYCSQGYCCYCYLLLSRCQADGKPCTMLPTSCALFHLLKGTGPDGVCVCVCVFVCVCVCFSRSTLWLQALSELAQAQLGHPCKDSLSLSLLHTKSASV